jgi:hypothetical protein
VVDLRRPQAIEPGAEIIADGHNGPYFSAASNREISIKAGLGRPLSKLDAVKANIMRATMASQAHYASSTTSERGLPMQMRRNPCSSSSSPMAKAMSWSISPSRHLWMHVVHVPLRQS